MKWRYIVTALFLLLLISSCRPTSAPVPTEGPAPTRAPIPSAPNEVQVYFDTTLIRDIRDVSKDDFSNGEVTFLKAWQTRIENSPDESGMPVSELELNLATVSPVRILTDQCLTRMGPPDYTWSFGSLVEGSQVDADAGFIMWKGIRFSTTPGFDASRSVDRTLFTSPGTQTLTITVTPQEKKEDELFIRVLATETAYVDAAITSPIGDSTEISQDRHQLTIYGIDTELNTTSSVTVTIQVTPKVPQAEFLPEVWVGWYETLSSGTIRESSLSSHVEELDRWMVTAEGDYFWSWEERTFLAVRWPLVSGGAAETDNKVRVDFSSVWNYQLPLGVDDFTNREVNGGRRWYTALVNTEDVTGQPIEDLGLTLTTDLETNFVWEQGLMRRGPPVYEWFFGDEPEKSLVNLGTGGRESFAQFPVSLEAVGREGVDPRTIEYPYRTPARWTPGFDVSRSADKTVFTSPGTQTLTITVTPRQKKTTN